MTELGFTAKDRMDKIDGHNLWAGVTTGLRSHETFTQFETLGGEGVLGTL